jgi:hypothetical protein
MGTGTDAGAGTGTGVDNEVGVGEFGAAAKLIVRTAMIRWSFSCTLCRPVSDDGGTITPMLPFKPVVDNPTNMQALPTGKTAAGVAAAGAGAVGVAGAAGAVVWGCRCRWC